MPEDTETAAVLAEGQPPAHSMKEADFIALMMKLKPGSERSDHVKSFKAIDTDHDSLIDAKELYAYMVSHPDLLGKETAPSLERITEMIKTHGEEGAHDKGDWQLVAAALELQRKEYDRFLAELPPKVRNKLGEYDMDGDGEFSLDEVKTILMSFHNTEKERDAEKAQNKFLKSALCGAIISILVLVVFSFISTLIANEVSKEMHVDEDGTVVSGDGTVLQTASKTTQKELSSRIPDKYLSQLETFSYIDPNTGASMSVTVNSFVRVPEQFAHCGSVVVLQTPLGNFTLDDADLYHAELDQWVDVTGGFSAGERRRMLEHEDGRRQLGASEGAATFRFLEDAGEELACTMGWDGSESLVEPHTPIKPYSYSARFNQPCVDEDDANGESKCQSTYGPNAGESKPGVSADGKTMGSIRHALHTHDMTVIIKKYANHPLQMEVDIDDLSLVAEGGNVTKLNFQLYKKDPTLRQRCTLKTFPDPGNVTFEDAFLSYLGVRDGGLRHWAISDQDGTRIADYFDDNSTGQPHSLEHNRGTPTATELRYMGLNEQLDDDAIAAWLNLHFADAFLYDINDLRNCEDDTRLLDTPTMMSPFREHPDTVDWYTKELLESEIDETLDDALTGTSMRQYWGGAMYLRRLLAQQSAEDHPDAAEPSRGDESEDAEVVASTRDLDFEDPWWWRELVTQWGTSEDYVQTIWSSISSDLDRPDVESLRVEIADLSSLTAEQLLVVPAPVQYVAKGPVGEHTTSSFSVNYLSFVPAGWSADELDSSSATYVVFGSGSSCSSAVYKVIASTTPSFTVEVVLTPDDPDTDSDEEMLAVANLDALDGTLSFFYPTYEEAAAASCDPAESDPSGGRRLRTVDRRLGVKDNGEGGVTGVVYGSRIRPMAGDSTNSIRRKLGWDDMSCTYYGEDGPGVAWLERYLGFEMPEILDDWLSDRSLGLLFSASGFSCGDAVHKNDYYIIVEALLCDEGSNFFCGVTIETDFTKLDFFGKLVGKLGVDSAPVTVSVTRIPEDKSGEDKLISPRGATYDSDCFYDKKVGQRCWRNYCALGFQTSTEVQLIGKEKYPFKPSYIPDWAFRGPGMVVSGRFKVADRECTVPVSGYSHSFADDYTNSFSLEAGVAVNVRWGSCGTLWSRGYDYNFDLEAGIEGKVSRVYSGKKKVGQYTGIRGYFDINVGAAAYTGRGCYCHRYCPLPAGSLGNTMCERNAVADYEIENPTWEVVHGLKNNPPYRDLPVAAAEEESDRYPCSQWASFEASVEGDVVLQKVGDELVLTASFAYEVKINVLGVDFDKSDEYETSLDDLVEVDELNSSLED